MAAVVICRSAPVHPHAQALQQHRPTDKPGRQAGRQADPGRLARPFRSSSFLFYFFRSLVTSRLPLAMRKSLSDTVYADCVGSSSWIACHRWTHIGIARPARPARVQRRAGGPFFDRLDETFCNGGAAHAQRMPCAHAIAHACTPTSERMRHCVLPIAIGPSEAGSPAIDWHTRAR